MKTAFSTLICCGPLKHMPSPEEHTLTPLQHSAVLNMLGPDAQLLSSQALRGGLSAQLHQLTVQSRQGKTRYVLKQPHARTGRDLRLQVEREFQCLQGLTAYSFDVPRPLALSPPDIHPPFFLMHHQEGRPQWTPSHRRAQAAGEQLARLHLLPTRSLHGLLPPKNAELAAEPQDIAGHHVPAESPPVLCHGDYWPGNLLWTEQERPCILDWEDAHLGPPLRDLAIARLDWSWIFGASYATSLTQAYLHWRPVAQADKSAQKRRKHRHLPQHLQRDLAYWDLRALLRLQQLMGQDLENWVRELQQAGHPSLSPRQAQQRCELFQYNAQEQLGRP